ncbi:MAG: RNA polymerase sigma factor [Alphaproteobacteria bacterium]
MAAPNDLAGPTDALVISGPSEPASQSIFSAIFRRYAGRMLAVCRRILGDREEAQDCVQDAFLNAYRNMAQFEGRAAVGSWLHRIVVNVALTRLRRRRWAKEEPLESATSSFDAEGCRIVDRALSLHLAEAVFEHHQHRTLMHRAILDLPARLRSVLVLRDIEGYSTAETADALGLTPAAVKVRLHRARLLLKQELEAEIKASQP